MGVGGGGLACLSWFWDCGAALRLDSCPHDPTDPITQRDAKKALEKAEKAARSARGKEEKQAANDEKRAKVRVVVMCGHA